MYQEKPRMNGYSRMPSRVNAIKWLGVLQLIHGILIFIVSIVLFAVDFEQNKIAGSFLAWIIHGMLLSFFAIGSGTVGASMSRYEGLIHNVSSKQTHMALSVMNAFCAIMYMVVVGTWHFYNVDKLTNISTTNITYRLSFALIVVLMLLALFNLAVACISIVMCVIWIPDEGRIHTPKSSPKSSRKVLPKYQYNPPLTKEPIVTVIREEDLLNYQDYPMARSYMGSYGRRGYKDVGLQPWDYYNGSKERDLENESDSYKVSFSMIVINLILAFFDMIVAFVSTILCALWIPKEGAAGGSYPRSDLREEPYQGRDERTPYSRSHLGAYGRGGVGGVGGVVGAPGAYPYDYYNQGYNGGGYRTLPALKY